MGIRHLARQRAMQLLFAMEYMTADETPEAAEHGFMALAPAHRRGWGPFARKLVREVYAQREALDDAIRPHLRHWTLERLPRIDRICLRMALCEMRGFPEIPLRVTLNEYIELVRMFGTDESPQFVNAVLDQMAKEFPQKDFQAAPPESPTPKFKVRPGGDQNMQGGKQARS